MRPHALRAHCGRGMHRDLQMTPPLFPACTASRDACWEEGRGHLPGPLVIHAVHYAIRYRLYILLSEFVYRFQIPRSSVTSECFIETAARFELFLVSRFFPRPILRRVLRKKI